jgi:CheY-like chemotaxis protein
VALTEVAGASIDRGDGIMSKVLIVDDSAVDRQLVSALLTKDGRWQVEFAENGRDALAQMKLAPPDLLVTDLQMPEIDGLELVAATRINFPEVPVILITAYGSELLATEALEQGAASYVPKSRLAEKLSETAEEVLSLATAERSYNQLIHTLNATQFDFSLDSNPALIEALVNLVQEMVLGTGFCDRSGRLQIGVALKAALGNALYRGNLQLSGPLPAPTDGSLQQRRKEPPYRDRKTHVNVKLSRDEVRFVIRDEGPGFDVAALPEVGDTSVVVGESGRGIPLMRSFMDEVRYNDSGNEVTMAKRRRDADAAEVSQS